MRRTGDLYVAYWNALTLQDVDVQALTTPRAQCGYCLSFGSGQKVIKVPGGEVCYHLYHSGLVDISGRHGVAVALSEAAHAALLVVVPNSSRLACARFKGTTVNLTVVAVYDPTLDAAVEVKDSFYDDLQDAVDRVPAVDILIIAGDWNAKPGPADPTTRHILGKISVGTMCANGDCLVNFASAVRLFVSSTRFQHPERLLRDRLPGLQ